MIEMGQFGYYGDLSYKSSTNNMFMVDYYEEIKYMTVFFLVNFLKVL